MNGKLVIRYEMTDEQLADWTDRRKVPSRMAAVVSETRDYVAGLLAASELAVHATITVEYK